MTSTRRTALITGASGGIGRDLAKLFAQNGYDLVVVARSGEALLRLAEELGSKHGARVTVVSKDLSTPQASEEIYRQLTEQAIPIDVLVNNAGFGTYGFFFETDPVGLQEMMQLNMVALTLLTRLFLKDMITRRSGKILNVASTAAFQPGPLMAVYYATKAYVLSFSEALANELRGTGVSVTVLCPGPTRTGFQKRASMEESNLADGGTLPVQDSETVARAGYDALTKGKTLVITGWMNRLLAFSVRLGPRRLVTAITRRLQEKGQSTVKEV